MKISAVLITRESEYPKDVDLSTLEFDQVVVETRCPHVFRRYQLAAEARHNTIYFQDDDCSLLNIKDLLIEYIRFLPHGLSLTYNMTSHHAEKYAGTGVALVGWGAFLPKRLVLEFLGREAEWRAKFGDKCFEEEADRMFTFQHRALHHQVMQPFRHFQRSERMSARPEHNSILNMIVRELNK